MIYKILFIAVAIYRKKHRINSYRGLRLRACYIRLRRLRAAMANKQELSYSKQIARKLRTQYAEDIYDNPVTLKSINGHSRSLETEPLDRSYTVPL